MEITLYSIFFGCVISFVVGLLGYALFRARIRLVEAEARLKSQEELSQAKANELVSQRESLRSEFVKLAVEQLGAKQKELTQSNEASVRTLFTDLKSRLEKYEKEV